MSRPVTIHIASQELKPLSELLTDCAARNYIARHVTKCVTGTARATNMPALTNVRRELFCQLVKRGIPPYRAYPLAGYSAAPSSPYRMLEDARVKRRLAELTRHIAVKTLVTVESVTRELDAVTVGATAAEQFGAARAAIETKAKLHGLLVERKETGQPGDFAALASRDAVLAMIRAEYGDQAADMLNAMTLAKALPVQVEPDVVTIEPEE